MSDESENLMSKNRVEIVITGVFAVVSFSISIFVSENPALQLGGFTLCAVSLLILWGPSLKYVFQYITLGNSGKIYPKSEEKKFKLLNSFFRNAKESIRIITSEFEQDFFEIQEVIEAFGHALNNNVGIEIISGDRARPNDEAFLGSLIKENSVFLRMFKEDLLSGRIRFYYGPRTGEHAFIIDGDTIIRGENPLHQKDIPWHWKKHTAFLGDLYTQRFEILRGNTRLLDFRHLNFPQ